jgi:RNA polymerase sigma-70 factor (ECF subfamily)
MSPELQPKEETELLSLAKAVLSDMKPIDGIDAASLTRMLPSVYDELRKRAAGLLKGERAEHTLQPTALVHEAYLRLAEQQPRPFQNRAQFLCIAARMMRRVLMNHAIARKAAKRGSGKIVRLQLDAAIDFCDERDLSLGAVNEALEELEKIDRRQGQIVELRFFAGMTVEEIAEALDISQRTVKREWATAKHWLRREIARAA